MNRAMHQRGIDLRDEILRMEIAEQATMQPWSHRKMN